MFAVSVQAVSKNLFKCRGNSAIQNMFASTSKSCQAEELWVKPYGFHKTWWLEIYFHFTKQKSMPKHCVRKIQHQEKAECRTTGLPLLGFSISEAQGEFLQSASSKKRETSSIKVPKENFLTWQVNVGKHSWDVLNDSQKAGLNLFEAVTFWEHQVVVYFPWALTQRTRPESGASVSYKATQPKVWNVAFSMSMKRNNFCAWQASRHLL